MGPREREEKEGYQEREWRRERGGEEEERGKEGRERKIQGREELNRKFGIYGCSAHYFIR